VVNQRNTLLIAISLGAIGVAIGAFGAHGLKDILTQNNRADTFELAVRYQFYHSFALLFTGILMRDVMSSTIRYAAICFTLGILFFSGSLYTLSLTGATILGAVTPFGGLLFITGWILLFAAVLKNKKGLH
jgi:uncharacterized membrane protein YgdD (TMEM256/DUF423 family)